MNFTEALPPKQSEIVVPLAERPHNVLAVPELGILMSEHKYWRDVHDVAERVDDQMMLSVAAAMRMELQRSSRKAVTLCQATDGTSIEPTELVTWYSQATSFIAFSRMMRPFISTEVQPSELPEEMFSPMLGLAAGVHERPLAIFDLPANELRSCNLHAIPEKFEDLFEHEPPERSKKMWLENDSVYVKVQSPAQPSGNLEVRFMQHGVTFEHDEYVSATPYLKSTVWPAFYED